jgi:hypothetical protein
MTEFQKKLVAMFYLMATTGGDFPVLRVNPEQLREVLGLGDLVSVQETQQQTEQRPAIEVTFAHPEKLIATWLGVDIEAISKELAEMTVSMTSGSLSSDQVRERVDIFI